MLTEALREHADVVFPAEAYPEKEGTLVHPDGRVQRLRPAIGRPGALDSGVRPAGRCSPRSPRAPGSTSACPRARWPPTQLFDAVPFFAGLTLDEIGGRGVRWPARRRRGAGRHAWQLAELDVPPVAGKGRSGTKGALRLGTFRTLWARQEVDLSPMLHFCARSRSSSSSPADADRLGVQHGEEVEVGANGTRCAAPRGLRASVPGGSVFLAEGIARRSRPTC